MKKTIIILLGIVALLGVGGGAYWWFNRTSVIDLGQGQDKDAVIASMITFNVLDNTLSQERIDKYTQDFQAAKDKFLVNPNDPANFQIIMRMGDFKAAVGDYAGAVEIYLYNYNYIDKGSYLLNGNLAHLYNYFLHDYPKAEFFYNEALKPETIARANHYTYFSELYDLYHYNMKDDAKAEAVLERAINTLPDSVSVYFLAAGHCKALGNTEKAKEYFNKMLELDPTNEAAKQGLNNLAN